MKSWVGRTLAGFRLEEELGAGTMTTVFRAVDAQGNVAVVKVFHPFLRSDPRQLRRFQRESHLLARLVHPNIVRFRGYWEQDEALFYAMDHLAFPTLEQALAARGAFLPDDAAVLGRDMLTALDFAHQREIIHRDLKPSNLFLDAATPRAVLADFGLAKSLVENPITAAGTPMMGTPHYMAPEQVEGAETSTRTDIYQAGLVLFELLTGVRPFQGDTPFRAIMARCQADLPLDRPPGAGIPGPWRQLLARACARDPAARFASAQEMLAALRSLPGQPSTGRGASPPQP